MADSPYALRLSHASDWVKCAAYRRMNATSQAAVLDAACDHTVREEGTAMHWIAEQILLGRECSFVNFPLSVAPNGVEITDELFDGAQFYVDVLDSYQLMPWRIEEQLHARRIHEQCGGKPDAYGHDLFRRRVVEPDLKGRLPDR